MKSKKYLLAAAILVAAASLTYSTAFTQDASGTKKTRAKSAASAASSTESVKRQRAARGPYRIDPKDGKEISPYSLASRTALNRQDCKPNALKKDGLGIHGHYRTYGQWDPELKSIEGRKQFEACVKRGLDPTPMFAIGQRIAISGGGKFFGRGKDDCLKCHSKY